ncbi:MAG: DUF882 domain-containing protein [Parvibaculaceae bacterium]|nr:DUF882 domain-containing protein [Parvibaculaceae bacterium]
MTDLTRRSLLAFGAGAAALTVTNPAFALAAAPRALSFHNLHTGESFKGAYWENGQYVPDSLIEIRKVLRDFRTGDEHVIDTKLLDLLTMMHRRLDTGEPFQVISGYRSPKSNAMLQEKGSGVATHSYHMRGMAIDIRVAGRRTSSIQKLALSLQRGGVGYYPASDFVHVDVGPVRTWKTA